MSLVLTVLAAPAAGLSNLDPIGRLVARSTETSRIDQGFQQDRPNAVAHLPVVREAARRRPTIPRCNGARIANSRRPRGARKRASRRFEALTSARVAALIALGDQAGAAIAGDIDP